MRAPTGLELMLAVVALAVFGLMKLDTGTTAMKELELIRVKNDRVELQRVNQELRDTKDRVDRAAADSLEVLKIAIKGAEARADAAATVGRQTFEQIIESVPDSMPELRTLIERRELEHAEEIEGKDDVIADERKASDVLRGQLTAANDLLTGVQSDLNKANDQIVILEDLKDPGLSNLEAVSFGAGAYMVTTEILGGATLEGLVAGGVTFLVTKGGSKLIRWVF